MTVVVTSDAYDRALAWRFRWSVAYDRFGDRFVAMARRGDKEGALRMQRRAKQARAA